METINQVEKHLPTNRKTLLYSLRDHNWDVVTVEDDFSDRDLDEKWVVKSLRENKGFEIILWFFKYDGAYYERLNRVVATSVNSPAPGGYAGETAIEFDGRKFENQLKSFMSSIHQFRIKIIPQ